MSTELSRDRGASTSSASEYLSPLPVASAQTRHIRKIGREGSRSVNSHEAYYHTVAQRSSPVRVQFTVDRCGLARGTEVASSFSELVLVDGNEALIMTVNKLHRSYDTD
jgi:hypothetical protein